MVISTRPQPVKLFCRLIFTPQGLLEEAKTLLLEAYGPVDLQSKPAPFTATGEYAKERGPDLERCFVSFLDLVDPSGLAGVKVVTTEIEGRLAVGGQRTVNIDPGYLARDQLVLATAKEAAHRTYLGRGVYAEIAYRWLNEGFEPLEWTNPDFTKPEQMDFFADVRSCYLEQLDARSA